VILEVLEFVDSLMKIFGFEYEMEVSTKPKKAIGSDDFWENTTNAIKSALDENGFEYGIDEGGGAFYGPKIDIKILDSIGRKWQCGTIQVDMNLPERFNIEYVNQDNEKEQPVMIHRAILGSFERFIGILTEHCNGEFPFVVAPTQVVIIPVNSSDEQLSYAKEIKQQLLRLEVDCMISSKNESLNKRVRTAEKQRVPMIIVLGDSEVENKTVAIRDRRKRERSEATLSEFIDKIKQLNSEGEF
jgi:threonyl-tRNA synthetase